MKIAHICLSSFYIDERAYQENELVDEHVKKGHEVLVVASTHIHDSEGKRSYANPGIYTTNSGAKVIRLPYHPLIPRALAKSLRIHQGVYDLLSKFQADAILFHGICGWELTTVAKYKKNNTNVRLFADTHTDFINSARTFLSKWVLHYLYYRPIVHRALPHLEKILCISALTQDFARDFYGVPESKLEFYPLGGHPVSDKTYLVNRDKIRNRLKLHSRDILFIQSGKQNTSKKLLESLKAFIANKDARFRFVIIGVLMPDIRDQAMRLISSDDRIQMLGWMSPARLSEYLCAADIYVQPGSQSSTMQTSICFRCAVILEGLKSHRPYVKGNGWLLYGNQTLSSIFAELSSGQVNLEKMHQASDRLAREVLDYSKLADRIIK